MANPTRAATRAQQWKSQIGNYALNAERSITDLVPDENIRNSHLYKNTDPSSHIGSTQAREKFLDYLSNIQENHPEQSNKYTKTTSMKDLLGPEGMKLYKAAIAEEAKSRAFRDACMIQATTHYEGDKWDKKLVMWVGGPSASGKTTNAKAAVEAIADSIPKKDEYDNSGNDVVAVDGANERNLSQMRQMLLQVAVKKGYTGIDDLHENTKLNIKDIVKETALSQDGLNIVIPETFAESATTKRFDEEGAYKENEMRKYQEREDVFQVFSEVCPEAGKEDRFQTTIEHSAQSRAFLTEKPEWVSDDPEESDIHMNNREIGCESKGYNSLGYYLGVYASSVARDNMKSANPDGLYVKVTSDFCAYRKTSNGQWVECDAKHSPDILMAARDFQRWKAEQPKGENKQDLVDWFKTQRSNKNVSKSMIEIQPNDLITIPVENKNFSIQITKRDLTDYIAYQKETSAAGKKSLNVLDWANNQNKKGLLTTPFSLLEKHMDSNLRRTQSAPGRLQADPPSPIEKRNSLHFQHKKYGQGRPEEDKPSPDQGLEQTKPLVRRPLSPKGTK